MAAQRPNDAQAIEQMTGAQSGSLQLRRLDVMQLVLTCAFAILAGTFTAFQFGFGLSRFGGEEYLLRVALLSGVRGVGPAISPGAALVALHVWTHRLGAETIRATLLRVAPRTLALAFASILLAVALTAGSSALVAHWAFAVPWSAAETAARGTLSWRDIPAAVRTFALQAALAAAWCWFALPAMARRSWSLPAKLGAVWSAPIVVRIAIEIVNAVIAFAGQDTAGP